MKINSVIHYTVIQNSIGEKICDVCRDNVEPIFSNDEIKMMYYYENQNDKLKNVEHKLDNTGRYTMAKYNKVKRITFPIDREIQTTLTTKINTEHTDVISKMLKLVEGIRKLKNVIL